MKVKGDPGADLGAAGDRHAQSCAAEAVVVGRPAAVGFLGDVMRNYLAHRMCTVRFCDFRRTFPYATLAFSLCFLMFPLRFPYVPDQVPSG